MKVKIVYPKWPKLKNQPEFRLPPHGPVVFAAALGDRVEISFCDEHVQQLDFQEDADLIAMASHGRTGLARVFYGSVATGVLHKVDRPLLLIRAEDEE